MFFTSRRRHTRCSRDWSSDVCSSDLLRQGVRPIASPSPLCRNPTRPQSHADRLCGLSRSEWLEGSVSLDSITPRKPVHHSGGTAPAECPCGRCPVCAASGTASGGAKACRALALLLLDFLEMEGQPRQEIPTMLVLRHLGGVATVVGRAVSCQTGIRSEEHTSELQSRLHLVCRLLLEKKKRNNN